MKSIIISTGDELLTGSTLDTNTNWIASRLTELDVELICCFTVGDDRDKLLWAIKQATEKAQLVIITGGLGPTDDDLTRFVLADLTNSELIEDRHSLTVIENFFRLRNRQMIERNRIQAMIPAGADALDNPVGTAPGIKISIGQATVFALPGVPSEMKRMFDLYVAKWIAQRQPAKIYRKKIHCIGIGESNLVSRLEPIVKKFPQIRFGTTAKGGVITINLAYDKLEAIDAFTSDITGELGDIVLGFDDDTLSSVIGKLLKRRKQSLVTTESCTGGLIAKTITDTAGASEYFAGGFVCYSNELKQKLLGVPEKTLIEHGTVSEQTAEAMAKGAINATNANWSIATTGIAGPTGGTKEKPVGLVYIAIANDSDLVDVQKFLFGNLGRDTVRERATIAALNFLRKYLLDN